MPSSRKRRGVLKARSPTTSSVVILGAFVMLLCGLDAQPADVEQRIDALLARMTIEEKLGQLQQLDGGAEGAYRAEHVELARNGRLGSTLNVRGAKVVNTLQRVAVEQSRLKVPLICGFDVIHGYRTIFPIPLGEAASWDPGAVEQSAAIAAAEARAAGVHWMFAPMVDIARDGRWGRIAESAGEDPYLGAMMASARVRGFQGTDYSRPDKVVACAKHWVAYGAAEAGRDYNSTDVSEHTLRSVYFPPFKAAVEAGVGTFMSAFNALNGVPASGNPFTLTEVLRREWKFDGFVVSDYNSVIEGIKAAVAAETQVVYAKGADRDVKMLGREAEDTGGGQAEIDTAVTIARSADAVVLVVGETGEMSGEAASRASLDLPGQQLNLVKQIAAVGKPVAVVLMNGRPLSITWLAEHAPAILEAWFPGTEAGNAVADVLFGRVNPGGKLPVTFPRTAGQAPIYYNHMSTGRPPRESDKYTSKYLDVSWTPLYSFGHGLSYTGFRLSNLRLTAPAISPSGSLTVSADVENVGTREGDEVVQLYLQDVAASVARPVQELKGFRRVTLKPGERRSVQFTLTSAHLGFYDRHMKWVVEPGTFRVRVGTSSVGGLQGAFEVVNR